MKIEAPAELAELIKRNDELTASLAQANQTATEIATKFEASQAKLTEAETVGAALRAENDELKEKLDTATAAADAGIKILDSRMSELDVATANAATLTELLEAANLKIAASLEEVDVATQAAEQLEAAAAEAEETAEAVQDQLALLAVHLAPKGAVPEIVATGQTASASPNHAMWVKLSNSTSPADRIAARKLYNAHKDEIDQEVAGKPTRAAAPFATPQGTPRAAASPEDQALYSEWIELRLKARAALGDFPGAADGAKYKEHTELTIQARKLYNRNKASIDRCIQADAASASA